MTAKTKTPARPATPPVDEEPQTGPWQTPPRTPEERLRRIEAMRRQINAYVEFMCRVGKLSGTSAEAKEKAVAAFYDRMVVAERQLGRIHEDLRLG
jgi:hypothetical protein